MEARFSMPFLVCLVCCQPDGNSLADFLRNKELSSPFNSFFRWRRFLVLVNIDLITVFMV